MYINYEQKFELNLENLKDPIVLIGWPGIALIAKLAISSIKDSLNAELFLNIDYFDFPPKSKIEKGSLELPSAQVFYKSSEETNHENDLFILTGDFQPQSSEGVFEFSKFFCEKMDKLTGGKIKMYVSSGALVTEKIDKEPKIHICGTDKEIVQIFLENKNTILMDGGIIAGANGILPAWAGVKGFAPGLCLLAETLPLPMMALDPRASKALVGLIRDHFKLEMDFSEIDKKIKEMEVFFDSFKQESDNIMNEAKQDLGSDSYFR